MYGFLGLRRHSSLSSIASGKSSRLHPVSVQSCCRYALAGRPTPARPCEGFHRRTSLMSSSLLLQQSSAFLVRLIWMVLKCNFFKAAVVSTLLYECTSWTLTKRPEKKLDGNCTRMLRVLEAISQKTAAVQPPTSNNC